MRRCSSRASSNNACALCFRSSETPRCHGGGGDDGSAAGEGAGVGDGGNSAVGGAGALGGGDVDSAVGGAACAPAGEAYRATRAMGTRRFTQERPT